MYRVKIIIILLQICNCMVPERLVEFPGGVVNGEHFFFEDLLSRLGFPYR